MTTPPTKTPDCCFAPFFAPRAVYKGQPHDAYDASTPPNTPFVITAMENPHYQSRCRPIDSPDKYCQLETAIRPYLTKFSRDPFIPPLAPFKHQKFLRHISLLSLQTIYTGLINQDLSMRTRLCGAQITGKTTCLINQDPKMRSRLCGTQITGTTLDLWS